MTDPILEAIWRARAELIDRHGGIAGYFDYVQKLDRASRKRPRRRRGRTARPSKARTPR